MTLPLALSASSYNEDDASGTTNQKSKALYMSRNNLEIVVKSALQTGFLPAPEKNPRVKKEF